MPKDEAGDVLEECELVLGLVCVEDEAPKEKESLFVGVRGGMDGPEMPICQVEDWAAITSATSGRRPAHISPLKLLESNGIGPLSGLSILFSASPPGIRQSGCVNVGAAAASLGVSSGRGRGRKVDLLGASQLLREKGKEGRR